MDQFVGARISDVEGGPLTPRKENGWLENNDEDMAWKVGLEILEYCTELDVHEKSNCMQFLFQTNLLFA